MSVEIGMLQVNRDYIYRIINEIETKITNTKCDGKCNKNRM
jgi:hypothetical protein